jgi:hypothetical protein
MFKICDYDSHFHLIINENDLYAFTSGPGLDAAWEHYAALDALWYRDKEAARAPVGTAQKAS